MQNHPKNTINLTHGKLLGGYLNFLGPFLFFLGFYLIFSGKMIGAFLSILGGLFLFLRGGEEVGGLLYFVGRH